MSGELDLLKSGEKDELEYVPDTLNAFEIKQRKELIHILRKRLKKLELRRIRSIKREHEILNNTLNAPEPIFDLSSIQGCMECMKNLLLKLGNTHELISLYLLLKMYEDEALADEVLKVNHRKGQAYVAYKQQLNETKLTLKKGQTLIEKIQQRLKGCLSPHDLHEIEDTLKKLNNSMTGVDQHLSLDIQRTRNLVKQKITPNNTF